MRSVTLFLLVASASAMLHVKNTQNEQACASEDLKHRAQLQNKLAGLCEDMCKEVGAYLKCSNCPDFAQPDSTPGVMTWDELLEHMDNLSYWGHGMIEGWKKQASALPQPKRLPKTGNRTAGPAPAPGAGAQPVDKDL